MQKLLILIFFLPTIGFGQKSDSSSKQHISIIVSFQIYNHTKGNIFYSKYDFQMPSKNEVYSEELAKKMISLSLGAHYKGFFQSLEYAYKPAEGIYTDDFGHDKLITRYFGYQIWYDFFNKRYFPIKPYLSLNFAYVVKDFNYYHAITWGGGNFGATDYNDHSKTFLIEAPMGIYLNYKGFFTIITYNLPIISFIKGSFDDYKYGYNSIEQQWSKDYKGTYSGNSTNDGFEKEKKDLFGISVGYLIKL